MGERENKHENIGERRLNLPQWILTHPNTRQQNSHISLTVARVDNGQTGVAHRPALGTVDTTRGLHTVGTTMVQDFGGIGQSSAGLRQDRRAAGVDVGSRVPNVTVLCFVGEVGSGD